MRKNPVLGENLEDLHVQQESAPNTLLNPVQGENFEDLHFSSDDAEELEYQRSAPRPLLESPVQGENQEDLRHLSPRTRGTGMSMFCSTDCNEENEMIVGTSTSCSAVCGGRETSTIRRRRVLSSEIFGTSITGSAPASTSNCCMNSTTCSPPICGTGASRIWTGTKVSIICSAVCRWTPNCGRTSTRGVGRAASTSPSSNKSKCTVLAALGRGVFWPVAVFISLSSPPALAILSPRGAEWCDISARAMAIDCRSCLLAARSRRPLRRCAAPAARSTFIMSTAGGRLNR